MSHNVIILGAGASYDAGIPLLGNFIDKMIELAATGRGPRGPLSGDEKSILIKALDIRNKIENYHARVSIDQFNIEQILSVLVFESQTGNKKGRNDLEIFTKAIATTIDLTCNVRHDGSFTTIQEEGTSVYRDFWKALFFLYSLNMEELPTILSFNYDLVLERSLAQSVVGYSNSNIWRRKRLAGIGIDYKSDTCKSPIFSIKSATWGFYPDEKRGHILEPDDSLSGENDNIANIKLYKLHGSLNFPQSKNNNEWSMVKSVENAKIIPPVFNKADSTFASPIWKSALNELRNCKNLIVCGYSLPTSDTYMQYFLKAALGPNLNLNQICVFDPELHKNESRGEALKKRYLECFSQQFQQRIVFQPRAEVEYEEKKGTFAHMVEIMNNEPQKLFFGLKPAESTRQ